MEKVALFLDGGAGWGTSFNVDSKQETYAFWGEGGVSSHPSPYYEKPCILSLLPYPSYISSWVEFFYFFKNTF